MLVVVQLNMADTLIVLDKLDKHFALQEASLKLRTYRQELLGSNLANSDTPGYKAVDFDFSAALSNALDGKSDRLQMVRSDQRHLDLAVRDPFDLRVKYRTEIQPSIDGNTVDADHEMAQFSDNGLRYQATLTFMSSKVRNLMNALTSR